MTSGSTKLEWRSFLVRLGLGAVAFLVMAAPICGESEQKTQETLGLNPALPRVCIDFPPISASGYVYTYANPVTLEGYTSGQVDRVEMEETRGGAGIADPVLGIELDELLAEGHCRAGFGSVEESGAFTFYMGDVEPGYYEYTAVAYDDFGGYRDSSKDALIFITGGKSFGVSFSPDPVVIDEPGETVTVDVRLHFVGSYPDCADELFEMTYDTFVVGLTTPLDDGSYRFGLGGDRFTVTHSGLPNGEYEIVTRTEFGDPCVADFYVAPLVVEVATEDDDPPTSSSTSSTEAPVPEPIDVSGVWDMTVTVTEISGWCDEYDKYHVELAITQTGTALTALGFGDAVLEGDITGTNILLEGDKTEDGGTTHSILKMKVTPDGSTMSGVEEWSWTDGKQSCPVGLSDVEAAKTSD